MFGRNEHKVKITIVFLELNNIIMTHFKSLNWFVKLETFLVIFQCYYQLNVYELLSKIYLSYTFEEQIGNFPLDAMVFKKYILESVKIYKMHHKHKCTLKICYLFLNRMHL